MNPVIKHFEIPINEFIDAINERGMVHAKILCSYVIGDVHTIEVEYTFKEAPILITVDPKIFEKETKSTT